MRARLLLVVLTLALPLASAGGPGEYICETEEAMFGWRSACDELEDPTRIVDLAACLATAPVCEPVVDIELNESYGTFYVSAAPPGLYYESNGCAGFQATSSECGTPDRRATLMDLSPLWPAHDPVIVTVPRVVCGAEAIAGSGGEACAAVADEDAAYQRVGCVARATLFGTEEPCGFYAGVPYDGMIVYAAAGPYGFYVESNGCDGLQQVASDCDGDGGIEPRDRPLRPSDLGVG